MSKEFELTRRRILGGLGTIGVAGAAAGLGTSAYLSDEESFEDNMMTAGELDLAVDYVVHEDQGSAGTYTINSFTGEVNGESSEDVVTLNGDGTAMSQKLGDVKPGDYGYSRFCFTIDDNPAYLWACGELTSTSENDYTEPEPEDDNGEGELEEAIDVEVRYCELDDEGNLTGDGEGEMIMEGSLREVLTRLQTGIPLDGTGDASASAGSQSPYAGTGEDDVSGDVTNPCLCFKWHVPEEVGNEIQGDSLAFDLEFNAIQSRHNDGSANPCADAVLTSDATGGIRETDNWITAYVSAGPTTVINVYLDGEVYGGGDSGLGEWPSNEDVYFMEANIDIDNDGIDEAANDDDFRVGYAAANSGARAGAISNTTSGASGDGGYIRRNTGGSNSGDAANRTDVAEEDVPGFSTYESGDQLMYTMEIDWSRVAGDSDSPTAQLSSAPGAIQVNEVFGGDGGEGVGAKPNSSNDGRGDVDNVTDGSGTLSL
jgi:predicted ribosomally synthesized peptide with SipW-like signal peptide